MITNRIILKDFDWAITILYDYKCSDIPDIIDHLNSIGYNKDLLSGVIKAHIKNITKGLVYFNPKEHRCIVVYNNFNIDKEDALVTFIYDNIIQKQI